MRLLAELGRLDRIQIERIMLDVAAALAVYHRAGEVHGNVSPTTIAIDEGGTTHVLEGRSDDPEFREPGPATARGDVYAAIRVLQFLLVGTRGGKLRHAPSSLFGAKLAGLLSRAPARRPIDGDGLLAELRELAIAPVLESVERPAYRASDPVEDSLLEAVWRADDDHARAVYLDWLEQHEHTARLAFVRDEVATDPSDATWRAVVAQAPIAYCPWKCEKRWHRLARTRDDLVRHCLTCDNPVRYCTSLEDAYELGSQRSRLYVVDAALSPPEVARIVDGRSSELAGDPDGRHPRMMRPGPPHGFCPLCDRDVPLVEACPTHGTPLLPISNVDGMRVVQVGGHRVGPLLAEGAPRIFGEATSRTLAIKLVRSEELPPELVLRVVAPSLVRIHEVGSTCGWTYIVMDRLEAHPLHRKQPLSEEQSFDVAEAVLSALAAIHAAGRVHGRLSPSKVQLAYDRGVYLLTGAPRPLSSTLRDEFLLMAPAVLHGGAPTVETDLISAGRLLSWMLSRSPVPDRVDEAISLAVTWPPLDGQLHPVTTAFINRLAQGDPETVALGAEQLLARLRVVRRPMPLGNPPPPRSEPTPDAAPPAKPGAFVRIKNWFKK